MSAKLPTSVSQKIQSFCDNRAAGDSNLNQSSAVYKQIVNLTNQHLQAPQRKGGLDTKQKVLTLVGIHATHGTDQSIHFAVLAALEAGASQEEIMDSLDLALLTGGGSAVARVQFAANVMEHYKTQTIGQGGKDLFDFAKNIAVSPRP